ncbi:MAG TPA: metallophosphoesterase [Methanocellaceae archaeon]
MAGSTLLISDIHADAGALDQILGLAFSEGFSERYGPVGKVLNLGDVMERGHRPKETVDRLRGLKNIRSILGNHDEAFLQQKSLSGSDVASISAHEQYRKTREYDTFFKDMGLHYVDRALKLYAVHGGPLAPGVIADGVPETDAWLFSQTWQRISDMGFRYLDSSGYHYLPEDAFESMKDVFEGPGYVIVCGHEHQEAAYVRRDGRVEDALGRMGRSVVRLDGRDVEEKRLLIEESACYLVRLGLAGPEGYAGQSGFGKCHFGVLSPDPRSLCLLSFGRD